MKSLKKFSLISLSILSFSSSFAARKTLDFAYVDIDHIFENIPEYLAELKELEYETKTWQEQIDKKKIELIKLKEKLGAERLILPPETIIEKENEIATLEKGLLKYQNEKFGTNGEFIQNKELIMKPFQEQIYNVLTQVAKEKRIKIIFEKSPSQGSNILFAVRSYDITDLVLKKLERKKKSENVKNIIK